MKVNSPGGFPPPKPSLIPGLRPGETMDGQFPCHRAGGHPRGPEARGANRPPDTSIFFLSSVYCVSRGGALNALGGRVPGVPGRPVPRWGAGHFRARPASVWAASRAEVAQRFARVQARGTEPYPQSCLLPRSRHSGAKQRDREHARSQDMPGGPPPSRPTQAAACPACPRVRQIRIVGPAQIFSESVCLWLAAPICVFRVSGPRISVPSPAGIEFSSGAKSAPPVRKRGLAAGRLVRRTVNVLGSTYRKKRLCEMIALLCLEGDELGR